jgi:hypothetical protein
MDVPASSGKVLRRLRYPDKTRALCIDALCINQNDHVKEGSQVALISEIYGNSRHNPHIPWRRRGQNSNRTRMYLEDRGRQESQN